MRMLEHSDSIDDALAMGFRAATARTPAAAELAILRDLHTTTLQRFRESPESAAALVAAARVEPREDVDAVAVAARIVIANVLLNLDEFVTRG